MLYMQCLSKATVGGFVVDVPINVGVYVCDSRALRAIDCIVSFITAVFFNDVVFV